MIDTHSHLDFSQFDVDREKVIERFLVDGGKWLVNIGVNTERNQKTLELIKKYQQIYCALGYHPEELAEKLLEELLLEAENFLKKNGKEEKVVAIGEIGLDYFHNSKNKEDQKKLFIKQLEIAGFLNLPVILHCREAYEDVLDIMSKFKNLNSKQISISKIQKSEREENMKIQKKNKEMRFVLHCYGGNLVQTEKFLELSGAYFSFTGNITFPRKNDVEIFDVIRRIPENRIMVETDCPFLAPNPYRGKRNEPSYVKIVIEKLAEIRGVSFEKMEKITDKNAWEFFKAK